MPTRTQHSKADEELTRPVQFAKGVGPARAELLNKLGIHTVADLLFFFPRDYQDFGQLSDISELQEDHRASVVGRVCDIQQWTASTGTQVLAVLIEQREQYLRGLWFNQNYLLRKIADGQEVMLQGKPKLEEGRWQIVHPTITWFQPGETPSSGTILANYRLTQGLSQQAVRRIVAQALETCAPQLGDVFPEDFRARHDLVGIESAVRGIHQPADQETLTRARHRLVYQELFVMQTALAMRREQLRADQSSPCLPLNEKVRSRILHRFPFALSESQLQAIDQITEDLMRAVPMSRLLHGEVGSGKTVVAMFAMLMAVAHGHQAVMLAPTELLALQHVRTFRDWLANGRVEIASWTGSQSTSERREIRERILSGRVQIVVGTHALFRSPPEFQSLAIAVVDEQHKFGVRQRSSLRQTGGNPHYLVMTATPIPRTISMTVFGDLDVSTLQRDPARTPKVHSYLGQQSHRDSWWNFVSEKLREGRQAYVVAPLIDANEASPVSSAEEMLESLANGPLEPFRLDLLHGQQSTDEKESVMLGFLRGHTQVLVATSIIEVGIDVPNATVLTIESAERFGLSQLHQLRGRVSRGVHPGYVCAFVSSETESAISRVQSFVDCNDGFQLAELDLTLRGPGNLLSSQQHGMPPLRIADLIKDGRILLAAREHAQELIGRNPSLSGSEFERLRTMVAARYSAALQISDTG